MKPKSKVALLAVGLILLIAGCQSTPPAKYVPPLIPPPQPAQSVTPSAAATVQAGNGLWEAVQSLATWVQANATAVPPTLPPIVQNVTETAQATTQAAAVAQVDAKANDAAQAQNVAYIAKLQAAIQQGADAANAAIAQDAKDSADAAAWKKKYQSQWFAGKFWDTFWWIVGIGGTALIAFLLVEAYTGGTITPIVTGFFKALGWILGQIRTVASGIWAHLFPPTPTKAGA